MTPPGSPLTIKGKNSPRRSTSDENLSDVSIDREFIKVLLFFWEFLNFVRIFFDLIRYEILGFFGLFFIFIIFCYFLIVLFLFFIFLMIFVLN